MPDRVELPELGKPQLGKLGNSAGGSRKRTRKVTRHCLERVRFLERTIPMNKSVIRNVSLCLGLAVVVFLTLVNLGGSDAAEKESEQANKQPTKQEPAKAPKAPAAVAKSEGNKAATSKPATNERSAAVGGIASSDPKTSGVIEGVVTFVGETVPVFPAFAVMPDHKDVKCCGLEIPSEKLIVDANKRIANVVVSLGENPALPKGKPRNARLTNDKCTFKPHVLAITRRSKVVVDSKDEGVAHNAHGYLGNEFNIMIAQTGTDKRVPGGLNKPGYTLIKCDLHSWMIGHLCVFKHDFFAVTGPDGKFRLEGVPPGEYDLTIWHETLIGIPFGSNKPIVQKVVVKAGETTKADIGLKEKAK